MNVEFIVQPEEALERLDKTLMTHHEDTRTTIQRWIEEGCVLVNGEPQTKAAYKVKTDDVIRLEIPHATPLTLKPAHLALDIVFEDEHLIVINKPAGLIVHPTPTTQEDTLVHALLSLPIDWGVFGDTLRPGIVHRIDKDTSGLLVVAKTKVALLALQAMIKKRSLKREYLAIVEGVIGHEKGTVDAPIGRNPKKRQQMSVVAQGKAAITHFEVLERFAEHTLVRCTLESGRTHQIRVHMQYIGHPVFGDPLYGYRKHILTTGQTLHAQRLTFEHPMTHETLSLEAALPEEFESVLTELRQEKPLKELI